MRRGGGGDEERKKLFRRMEWVYIYLPPILAVLLAILGGLILASIIPLEGTSFAGRWALGSVAVLAVPAVAYFLREVLRRR